jgi:hypothetical protein
MRTFSFKAYFRGWTLKSLLIRLILMVGFAASAVVAFIAFRHAGVGVAVVAILTYLSVLIVVMAIMLNYPRVPRRAVVSDFAHELEMQGRLVSTGFRADRAFRVDEFHDEGPHYFLELENGGILHLCGRYLYPYEPLDGSLRHFPCTEFTVRRHAEVGYVVDILCGGLIIEPEVEAPPYSEQDFKQRRVPKDGDILRNVNFDELRQERTAFRRLRS